MWSKLFASFLRRLIQTGGLVVTYPNGHSEHYGDGTGGPPANLRIQDNRTLRRILLNPGLAFGEAYMDGHLTIENDNLYRALQVLMDNFEQYRNRLGFLRWLRSIVRSVYQFNPVSRARRNVAHHYDLSDRLYDLFLDKGRQYSCAYFADPAMTLENAQEAKKNHIAQKLLLHSPHLNVLDIGCGWGGLSLFLHKKYQADVLGITLSTEQHKYAGQQAQQQGIAHGLAYRLQDYRKVDGRFDRIVSVGMFEHVGVPHYRAFFNKVRDLLTEDGVALLHSIGRITGPGSTNTWISKYIFPGGYVPALSEVLPAIERAGLVITDVEVLRLHYAETLRAWRERFSENRAEIARIYDERFCRMWLFYLIASELSFRLGHLMVFQIQLAKKQDAVPLTRDYLAENAKRQAPGANTSSVPIETPNAYPQSHQSTSSAAGL